jgi:hypothetical protein
MAETKRLMEIEINGLKSKAFNLEHELNSKSIEYAKQIGEIKY